MFIEITKPPKQQLKEEGVYEWPIWEKEVSIFDWQYAETEYCLILEGHAIITTDLEVVEIAKGDYVKFPRGLECKWEITEDIRKHYNFA